MKKKILFILAAALLLVPSAFAEYRLDMGIKIPTIMGVHFSDLSDEEDTSTNILDDYTFLVPEITGSYQMAVGPIKMGAGVEMYTFIFESIAWPMVFAELDLSRVVFNAKLGGLGFLVFGLYNHTDTANVVIPDIYGAVKLGKSLRLGLGVMGFTGKEFSSDALPYIFYLAGSLSMVF